MPFVTDELRAEEVRVALAEKAVRTIKDYIRQEISKIVEDSLENLSPERFSMGHFFYKSPCGELVEIHSLKLNEYSRMLNAQMDSLRPRRKNPRLDEKLKRGRKVIEGITRTRAGTHVLASINVSVGQTRRYAVHNGKIGEHDPLDEESIIRVATRNRLTDSTGRIPPEIYNKLKFHRKLTETDLTHVALA
jgi:hypothetical protein